MKAIKNLFNQRVENYFGENAKLVLVCVIYIILRIVTFKIVG